MGLLRLELIREGVEHAGDELNILNFIGRRVVSTKDGPIELDQVADLPHMVIDLAQVSLVDGLFHGFLELGWQLQVGVLEREADLD